MNAVNSGGGLNGALAAELRAERGAKTLTIAQVAERVGMHETQVLRYFNGKRPITIETLRRLAAGVDCPPAELLKRAEDRFEKAPRTDP